MKKENLNQSEIQEMCSNEEEILSSNKAIIYESLFVLPVFHPKGNLK